MGRAATRLELLPFLRSGASDREIAGQIRTAVMRKPEKHDFQERPEKIVRIMATTGG